METPILVAFIIVVGNLFSVFMKSLLTKPLNLESLIILVVVKEPTGQENRAGQNDQPDYEP